MINHHHLLHVCARTYISIYDFGATWPVPRVPLVGYLPCAQHRVTNNYRTRPRVIQRLPLCVCVCETCIDLSDDTSRTSLHYPALLPAPYFTSLHRPAPSCTILHHSSPACTVLHHSALSSPILHRSAPSTPACTILHRRCTMRVCAPSRWSPTSSLIISTAVGREPGFPLPRQARRRPFIVDP